MSYLFSSPPPTFAEEQLGSHLSSISTAPVNIATSASLSAQKDRPSPALESALSELSSAKPPTRQEVKRILQSLVKAHEELSASAGGSSYVVQSEMDKVVEAEVMARAVTIVWKEILNDLLSAALDLGREKAWWDSLLNSRQGVAVYLIQSTSTPARPDSILTHSFAPSVHQRPPTPVVLDFALFHAGPDHRSLPSLAIFRALCSRLSVHAYSARSPRFQTGACSSTRRCSEPHRRLGL